MTVTAGKPCPTDPIRVADGNEVCVCLLGVND